MKHVYNNFTDAYYGLLQDVYDNPDFVSSPRGLKIKEKLGVRFEILNPRNRLPFITERNFSVSYVVAEALWYFAGLDSTEWISKYSAFWSKISDDGTTANSAYGARIFKPHPRIAETASSNWTQWQGVIDELVSDSDSRRAVIHIRSPLDSLLAKKDVPCTLTLQFFLRDDKLYLVVSMRSSDLVLGIGNDIPAFTLFQEAMALELSKRLGKTIQLGSYVHVSNSLHLYERNFTQVENILNNRPNHPVPTWEMNPMPSLPPCDELLTYEKELAAASTPLQVRNIVSKFELCGYDDYWADWVRLLASHRAAKLGETQLQQALLSETSYFGFNLFQR